MNQLAQRKSGRLSVPGVGLAPGVRRLHSFELEAEAALGATGYRLVLADSGGHRVTLRSESPSFDLGPVWQTIAPGYVRYNTLSYDDSRAALNPAVRAVF